MIKQSVFKRTALSGLSVVIATFAPVLAHAHQGVAGEHLHLTEQISVPTFGFLSFGILIGLIALFGPMRSLGMQRLKWAPIAIIIFFASGMIAEAHHVMNSDKHPVIGGFTLPFHGADHLLAMVAVGLWAASSKPVKWVFPASFMGFMLVGMILGFARVSFPYVETGIWVSVVAFGLLLAVLGKMPNRIVAILTGAFGIFHGYACGADMPNAWSPWAFGTGLIACTLGLIGLGLLVGSLLSRWKEGRGLRIAGAVTAAVMIGILVFPLIFSA